MKPQKEYLVMFKEVGKKNWWLGAGGNCKTLKAAKAHAQHLVYHPPSSRVYKIAIFEKLVTHTRLEVYKVR